MEGRINPSLISANDYKNTKTYRQLTRGGYNPLSTATRPPLVGREMSVDMQRDPRYSTGNTELGKYLKALQQKTISRKNEATNSEMLETFSLSSDSDSKMKDVAAKNSRFLKPRVSTNDLTAGIPEIKKQDSAPFVPVRSGRISEALQKADAFSNKYKPKPVPPKSNLSKVSINKMSPRDPSLDAPLYTKSLDQAEEFPPKTSSPPDSVTTKDDEYAMSQSEGESLQSLLNVMDIVDLAPSSGSSKGSDENVPSEQDVASEKEINETSSVDDVSLGLQVKGVEDLLHVTKSNYVTKKQHHSHSLTRTSSDDTSITEYSDDFDEGKSASSKSASFSERKERHEVSHKLLRKNEKTEKPIETKTLDRSGSNSMKDVYSHKETQTSDADLGSNVILINNLPVFRSSFPAYVDPCRVSSVIVRPEVLEALSSYKPAIFALNEMMKQNLNGSRLCIESHRSSYVSAINTLRPNYHYTTWENTLKYLEKYRKKRPVHISKK